MNNENNMQTSGSLIDANVPHVGRGGVDSKGALDAVRENVRALEGEHNETGNHRAFFDAFQGDVEETFGEDRKLAA